MTTTDLAQPYSPCEAGAPARVMPDAARAASASTGSGLDVVPRVRALVAAFETIARTRMAGVPVLNPALRVEAVGFQALPVDDDEEAPAAPAALGILITPWFMNLVRLPLQREAASDGVGRTRSQAVGATSFEFIGAHEPDLGAFSACSLFSPMFEFADHAAARDTALAVLESLRATPTLTPTQLEGSLAAGAPGVGQAQTAQQPSRDVEPPPARRAFLFGRSAVRGATP